MKIVHMLLILYLLTISAYAQELWMEPSKFVYAAGDSVRIRLNEGVDFAGSTAHQGVVQDFSDLKSPLDRVFLHQKNTVTDMRGYLNDDALVLPPGVEGTLVFSAGTTAQFRELEAEAFNTYLKEAALDDAHYERQRTNSLDKNGKELITYLSKLIVQTGKQTDDTYKKETGAVLEIIPQQHPSMLKIGDRVQFKIMYKGNPLFGARVKVWNRYNHRTSVQNIFTEQNGLIETHISNPGTWMVSVVKMIAAKDPRADWESYKGTLVFGVK